MARISLDGGKTFTEVEENLVIIEGVKHYRQGEFQVRINDEGVFVRQTGGKATGQGVASMADYHALLHNPIPKGKCN